MKVYYDKHVQEAPVFAPGDKVWLNARNLKLKQLSKKLSPKRLGSYAVQQKLGDLDYELVLPKSVPVHPVFHVSLLSKYTHSDIPGREPEEPPAIEVEGDEEYEVERIKDSRIFRRQLQYLVKWKGYDNSHTSWKLVRYVANALALIADFHRKNPNAPRCLNAAVFSGLNFQPMPLPLTEARCHSRWEMGKGTSHEVMRR
ncbi:hypothetical protein IEO21_08125 [Rhodonia placenta]|uniref:Chromo domain-containing protein n=1 Tax=Rhodonia placenta TaxID=104341 RepID=A0A8H7NWV9_9APHY|nr:hypothetical protein IEO21_08125 [Postia placenta]